MASEKTSTFGLKQRMGLWIGPLAGLIVYALPLPNLNPSAHLLAAILICVVTYWVTEPIPLPITALLGTTSCVVMGLGSTKEVFSAYAHPIIFLFIGSFFIAEALVVHGVHRRMAIWILSLSWVRGRPMRIAFAISATTAVLSMWISNTAATAIMLPIVLGVLKTIQGNGEKDEKYELGMMLLLAYGAGIGGVATVIGTAPNLIGVGYLAEQVDYHITFFEWMTLGLPLSILMLLLAFGLVSWMYPSLSGQGGVVPHVQTQGNTLGPLSRGEINACISFGFAVVLWIVPGLLVAFLGPDHAIALWFKTHLPKELVAILAAGLLFLLPVDWKTGTFTLTWREATNISWGTILLFGGGLAFGYLMIKTRLAETVGNGIVNSLGVDSLWGLTAIAIVATLILTEMASNTASASMLVPIVIAISQSAGVSPLPPTLAVCMAASLAFVLPVSTPPNAIVYGTGLVPITAMVRTGIVLDLLGGLLIWVVLWILCPILGMT